MKPTVTRPRKAPVNHSEFSLHWFRIKLIARTRQSSHVPHTLQRSKTVIKEDRMWNYIDYQPVVSEKCLSVPRQLTNIQSERKHHWVNDLNGPVLGYSLSQGRRVPSLSLTHNSTNMEENTSLLKHTYIHKHSWTSLNHWLWLWRRRGHV